MDDLILKDKLDIIELVEEKIKNIETELEKLLMYKNGLGTFAIGPVCNNECQALYWKGGHTRFE